MAVLSVFSLQSALIASITFAVYLAALAVYRLFFDPLSQIPGPKLAAVTRYYEAYFDVIQGGQYTNKIDQLHRQYGPIIRISPYELHIKDPTFFGQLYRQDGNWSKYEWMQRAFAAGPKSTFNTVQHDLHRQRRAPLDLFFSKASVIKRQEIVRTVINKLYQRISQAATQEIIFDLGDALAAAGTDIGTKYILGESFNNLDRADYNMPMTNMIRTHGGMWRATKHITILGPILLAMPLNVLEKVSGEESKQFVAFLRHNKAQTEVEMAKFDPDKAKDDDDFDTMTESILKSKQLPQSEKTLDRINNEVDAVTSAGIETVGQTLRLTCFHIYDNPKILKRLREELADVARYLGPNAAVNNEKSVLSQLERLPYLVAVVKEGLRMSPGVGTRMARIAPDRMIRYGSYRIPAGTPVGMTVLLMHYDEGQYPDPLTFSPERWLSEDGTKHSERVFAPFSRGTRMCVGMQILKSNSADGDEPFSLAYAELYMIIATLVTNFDMKLIDCRAEDVRPSHDSFVIGTKAMHGPKVQVVALSK